MTAEISFTIKRSWLMRYSAAACDEGCKVWSNWPVLLLNSWNSKDEAKGACITVQFGSFNRLYRKSESAFTNRTCSYMLHYDRIYTSTFLCTSCMGAHWAPNENHFLTHRRSSTNCYAVQRTAYSIRAHAHVEQYEYHIQSAIHSDESMFGCLFVFCIQMVATEVQNLSEAGRFRHSSAPGLRSNLFQ